MILKYFGKTKEFDKPIKLADLLEKDNTKYLAAKVNNRIRELKYIVSEDADIEFLDLHSRESMTIYRSSLIYIICKVVQDLFPDVKVSFSFSVSRSIYASFSGFKDGFTREHMNEIKNALNELVEADLEIDRYSLPVEEAKKYYKEHNSLDKTEILNYRQEKTVHMYKCGEYLNYMFGYMVPSTRFLSKFVLKHYTPGMIIMYPRNELGGEIPEFKDDVTFVKTLKDAANWGEMINANSIAEINHIIENNKENEFINLCETKHNNQLAELGELIKKDIKNIRLIAVAGPSSSGKTTFTNRLKIELMTRGITPVMISIDDYYKGIAVAPKDKFGNPDLEHINALDIELFNNDMVNLIDGKEVTLPMFDFEHQKRLKGKTVKLQPDQPIMIEGIHALNDDLTPSIPLHQKFKIYIAPQAQLHIDDHNPIAITDIRLIRRIVRDFRYRNYPALETLKMWSNVRLGEFKWIYPYQVNANYVYNSELTYELCVLKKYALEQLTAIPNDSEYFIMANRLIKFLKYFKYIPEKYIPCNSILREFIGGSIFYNN